MKEFTFCIVTYNQEQYIGQLLESIKYQILNYARDIKVDIIISDDLSKDNTMKIVNQWIQHNYKLFRKIDVSVNENNIGVVANIYNVLKKLKTNKFKLIAGDDIFLSNNIFSAIDKDGLVMSPTIKFRDREVLKDTYLGNYFEVLWPKKKNVRRYMLKKLKNHMFIETPGVFFDSSLLTDELFDELSQFSWIEDVPMWSNLLKRNDLKVTVSHRPLVGYRLGSGISTNCNHQKNEEYENEVKKIQEKYQPQRNKYIVKIKYIWIRRLYKYIFSSSKIIKEFVFGIKEYEGYAEEHIRKMQENYEKWKAGISI